VTVNGWSQVTLSVIEAGFNGFWQDVVGDDFSATMQEFWVDPGL
jgi:hypothetical protein